MILKKNERLFKIITYKTRCSIVPQQASYVTYIKLEIVYFSILLDKLFNADIK